jgi:two-component system, OmpR family, sensor histidine kinase SenX3
MLAIVLAFAAGVGLGIAICLVRSSRRPGHPAVAAAAAVADPDHIALRLTEAVDHLEIGVVIASASGSVVYRNAAAQSTRGTHVGLVLDDHLATILSQTRAGEPVRRVVELHGPPRSWLEVAADPIPDGGAVATIRDVSERMRTDAMRTDFVTNISHELKTPVGAVAVLAEALMDESDPEIVHRLADHLVEESHRAVRTIDDLLRLSQIESTRPGDSAVDLISIVRAAIGRGRSVDAGRGVQITVLDMPDELWIRGDELQLQSAIGNLVENAVKYSHPGDVVQLRTRVDDAAVEVMVADQGVGIPSRDLDRIFERFYRVDKARSRDTGGSGLGLSIVRHVATNHGGEVLVSSHEGEGSTFVLRLPASLVVAPPDERDDAGSATDSRHSGRGAPVPDGEVRINAWLREPSWSSRTRRASSKRSPSVCDARDSRSSSPSTVRRRSRSSTRPSPTSCCST